MRNYEKPVVLSAEEMAEGVYLASGGGAICWTASIVSTQDYVDGNHIFEIRALHLTSAVHISTAATFRVQFNSAITGAFSENGWTCNVNGNIVDVTRVSHANAYNSGDSVSFKIWVSAGDEATTKALSCTIEPIDCDKKVNVQGGID